MHDYTRHKLPSSFDTFKHNYEIHESHQTRQSNLLFIERSKYVFASQLPYTFPMWNKWINNIPEYTSRNNLTNLFKNTFSHHMLILWSVQTNIAEIALPQ